MVLLVCIIFSVHENPDIADCQIHLNHLSGDALLESFTFSCDNENNPPFFTNYKDINRIQVYNSQYTFQIKGYKIHFATYIAEHVNYFGINS